MTRDKKHKVADGEITVGGPGERGRVRLEIYDRTILLTPAQARRLGADLIRRALG